MVLKILSLSALMVLTGGPAQAGISAWIVTDPSGNYRVMVQNRGSQEIGIRAAVVNRKDKDPMCRMTPVRYPDGSIVLTRTDADLSTFNAGLRRVAVARLGYGDEAEVLVYRGCGALLELKLVTDLGAITLHPKE